MPDDDREAIRLHLVAEHSWPAVWRYEATTADLQSLHDEMHDPEQDSAATAAKIRQILGMPPPEDEPDDDDDDDES